MPSFDSEQNNIELLCVNTEFSLQRNGLANEFTEPSQMQAFLFLEQIDHLGRGQHAKLFGTELACFAQDFAQDVVGHCPGGIDNTATLTMGTRLAQELGQRFARALAGHFHQAQRRKTADTGFYFVTRQLLRKFC